MPSINAANLKILRGRKRWSLDALAQRSRVDRGTISRIENGKQVGNRQTTKEKLAEALGVSVEILTSVDSLSAPKEFESSGKSQYRFQMENSARNALALVSSRYAVEEAQVLHLAPFLFLWAAEESLRQRRSGLDTMESELHAIRRPSSLRHLHGRVENNWHGEEALEAERQSIANRDLFGLEIDGDALRDDYDEYEENPMSTFLSHLATSSDGLLEFNFWYPSSQPYYWLCEDDVFASVGGDKQAICNILYGHAPLHEVPREVSEAGPAEVAAWAKQRGSEAVSYLFDNLNFDLGGEDDS